MTPGRFFFRIIEDRDGRWSCKRGAELFDSHTSLAEAIEHLTAVAGEHRPSEVFVHHIDGHVRQRRDPRLSSKTAAHSEA